jgi:hypothetical protein
MQKTHDDEIYESDVNEDLKLRICITRVRVMVFNTTFSNISVISRLVLLVEETGENHRPVASH